MKNIFLLSVVYLSFFCFPHHSFAGKGSDDEIEDQKEVQPPFNRCEAFDSIHRSLYFTQFSCAEDNAFQQAFKKLGKLMPASERELMTLPSAFGGLGTAMKQVYDEVWKDADNSSNLTAADIEVLRKALQNEEDADGFPLSECLDKLIEAALKPAEQDSGVGRNELTKGLKQKSD